MFLSSAMSAPVHEKSMRFSVLFQLNNTHTVFSSQKVESIHVYTRVTHIDAASTAMEKWPSADGQSQTIRGSNVGGSSWAGWDLLGREAASSPNTYFEHVNR